ncbi:T6SS immunity protein Tli4 family protein [Massilia sp. TWR1-2-2]|uniref:T6SS immunity protein Tli4 family protein n=1 Tax=Massilia sp. TWR1-2-2 TaxID=2804584 RepID=UPI003CE69C7A
MPESVKLSPRLQLLFAKTKLVCFGRYAVEVPLEAELITGSVGLPALVKTMNGGQEASKVWVAGDIAKIKADNNTAEIVYNGRGPVDASWQLRYFEDEYNKKRGALYFQTYINKGDITFLIDDSVRLEKKFDEKMDTESAAARRQAVLATNLRLRAEDEVPAESGFCIKHAFIPEKLYSDQETASAGLFLPSVPDVTFSISSNKDAYGDYPPAEFEKYKKELSLLSRIKQAKTDQGMHYPSRTVLREGERNVQHWHGEESLIKRADGVHDFEWAFVGTPRDVANPSEFGVTMFTKVEHNTVGAAKSASVTDDEAVALWDKLLSGLKFRVKVPGASEGSYHLQPKN